MVMILAGTAVSPVANTLGGQGWLQAGELGVALLLSAAIGLEREVRHKDAGLRTHILVGVGSALFMLISKYGFTDVLEGRLVVLDPSRMAAQIVSGIGFIGAGLIFVRRDAVRGLTTAAAIWVTAAVGAAAGAGLLVLAALTTGVYVVVTLILPLARQHLPLAAPGTSTLRAAIPTGTASCGRCSTRRPSGASRSTTCPPSRSATAQQRPASVNRTASPRWWRSRCTCTAKGRSASWRAP